MIQWFSANKKMLQTMVNEDIDEQKVEEAMCMPRAQNGHFRCATFNNQK